MPRRPPSNLSDEELAAWLESEQGRKFLEESEWRPARFVAKDPTLVPVTIRLPQDLRERMRRLASARSMGYQTLARQWLIERCNEEEARAGARAVPGAVRGDEAPGD